MILALIGMAGVGKSHWSSKLAAAGFRAFHCDDLIAHRLHVEHQVATGSVHDLGQWMGFPHQHRYQAHAAIYLAYESAVLHEIASTISEATTHPESLVIDLTGSAIYAEPAALSAIRRIATIIYLAVGPTQRQQLLADYLAQPRPVIWGEAYQPLPNEPPTDALTRCYPQLIAWRETHYQAISHVQLEPAIHRDPALSVEQFLQRIREG